MKKFFKILLLLSFFSISANAYYYSTIKYPKFIKSSKALSPKQIKKLAKLLDELHGTKKVGKVLGKMKLPNEVLEDTFIRLAIYKKKIGHKEAEETMQHLKDVKSFRTTLRKVIGNSTKKTTGHLHELRLAKKASKNGFKVLGIGEKFSDGIKAMPSEMKPLASFAKQNSSKNVIPVFSITNKPTSKVTQKILETERKVTKKRNLKDKGQREDCGCVLAKDIGQYNTCPYECNYCYANTSKELAKKNYKVHLENPDSASILGT